MKKPNKMLLFFILFSVCLVVSYLVNCNMEHTPVFFSVNKLIGSGIVAAVVAVCLVFGKKDKTVSRKAS